MRSDFRQSTEAPSRKTEFLHWILCLIFRNVKGNLKYEKRLSAFLSLCQRVIGEKKVVSEGGTLLF